jgi:hypothetical protein
MANWGQLFADALKFLVVLVPWSIPENCFVFPIRTNATEAIMDILE